MIQYDVSPSIAMTNHGHMSPIAVIPSLDRETVHSFPAITKNLSMNSFSSQWSTATTQISNTTKEHSEKKLRRKTFLHFVEILMGIVKEKDERRFRNAKSIVYKWKRNNGIESHSESLRSPLKHAVGPQFWSEARQRLLQAPSNTKTRWSSFSVPTELDAHASDTTLPIRYNGESRTCTKTTVTRNEVNEQRIRKKKLWMVVRVLMQHLRKKHRHLYRKAHVLVNECVRQHKLQVRQTQYRNSLSGSIEACLKKEFGSKLWERAEYFVSEALIGCHEDKCGLKIGSII